MSKEHTRIYREKMIANDRCPNCTKRKTGKDLDMYYCFECRKLWNEKTKAYNLRRLSPDYNFGT